MASCENFSVHSSEFKVELQVSDYGIVTGSQGPMCDIILYLHVVFVITCKVRVLSELQCALVVLRSKTELISLKVCRKDHFVVVVRSQRPQVQNSNLK
ncbi:hypothetical protein V1478_018189 [Vespula squamosa]|uniref:Uncharacterized protein n=1 Tax=Vespula squamosa TaxID=30214 RepID=A0ABD1ZUC9_VESSQ